jgi:hypothetical protein
MMIIKSNHCYISVAFTVMLLLYTDTIFAVSPAEVISLQADKLEHIQFKKITANRISYQDQQLQIDVDNSASILMLPFDTVKQIDQVTFEWRSESGPLSKDLQHELERSGDDAVFKLGLLLKSDNDSINPFVPAWLKRVRELLKYPSEEMIYLVAGARHPAGERWLSPYNKRITMVSVASRDIGSGWRQSTFQSEQPLKVVALWLMADGDNTHAEFGVTIRNIVLKKSD